MDFPQRHRQLKVFRISLLLFVLCSQAHLSAQSTIKISGYVKSCEGEPLAGANVVVLGTGMGAATDASGYYAIENLFAGEYALQATVVGYRPETQHGVMVNRDVVSTVGFVLQPAALLLKEIVVEADSDYRSQPGFEEIIDSAGIRNSSARTIGELLVEVPGVDIVAEGGAAGRKRVTIRGSQANQVLVLLDGIPMNDPLTGEADLNQISLAAVDKIRIYKGGNSSVYGNGAMGGVIEISSTSGSVDEVRMKSHVGSYGLWGIQPHLSGRFARVNYSISLERMRDSGGYPYEYRRFDGTKVNEERINAGFLSTNTFGHLNFDFDRHVIQLQATHYNSERGNPGLVFAWTPYAEAKTVRSILVAKYSYQKENWQNQLQISRHVNATEFQNELPADAPLRFRSVPAYHTEYRIASHRAVYQSVYSYKKDNLLQLRTTIQADNFEDTDLLSGTSGPVRNTENTLLNASLHNEWHLPSPDLIQKFVLNSTLGYSLLRFKQTGVVRTESQLSPRLGILLSHSDGYIANIQANWGRSFRAPTFADLFYQDFRVRGNADLQPEKSVDLDAGVHFGVPLSGWLGVSATYFRHSVENLIVWQLGSFASWQPYNTDAELQGWEFAGSWDLFRDNLHINISHVLSDAKDKSRERTTHDKKLTYRPEHSTKIGLRLDLHPVAFTYHRRMVGPRFVTASNTLSMPAYNITDLTLAFRHDFRRLTTILRFSVYNAFDVHYEMVENAPLPGRLWRASLELGFFR